MPWYHDDIWVVKIIFGGLALLMSVLYYLVIYFTIFENQDEKERRNKEIAR